MEVDFMSYIKPENVVSPKRLWRSHSVLYDGGASEWSAAEGQWNNGTEWGKVLAIRWYGDTDKEKGNPQARGYPTWFIVPEDLKTVIRDAIRPKNGYCRE